MASGNARGERLIPIVIDDYAKKEPGRVWVSIPRNETALVEGYEDITYKQFANAINHAAWWLEHALSGCGESSQTFAYAGPKDLRYPILAVAAVKAGRPVSSRPAHIRSRQNPMMTRSCCLLRLRPRKHNLISWTPRRLPPTYIRNTTVPRSNQSRVSARAFRQSRSQNLGNGCATKMRGITSTARLGTKQSRSPG